MFLSTSQFYAGYGHFVNEQRRTSFFDSDGSRPNLVDLIVEGHVIQNEEK